MSLQDYGQPIGAPAPLPPCTECGKQMRLGFSSPSDHYANVDERTFVCHCGGKATFLVMREE